MSAGRTAVGRRRSGSQVSRAGDTTQNSRVNAEAEVARLGGRTTSPRAADPPSDLVGVDGAVGRWPAGRLLPPGRRRGAPGGQSLVCLGRVPRPSKGPSALPGAAPLAGETSGGPAASSGCVVGVGDDGSRYWHPLRLGRGWRAGGEGGLNRQAAPSCGTVVRGSRSPATTARSAVIGRSRCESSARVFHGKRSGRATLRSP